MNDHPKYLVQRKEITYVHILTDLVDSPIREFSHIAICLGPLPAYNVLNSFQAFWVLLMERRSPSSMLCSSFLCVVLEYNGPAVRDKLSSRAWIVVRFLRRPTLELMSRRTDCLTFDRSRCSAISQKTEREKVRETHLETRS